MSILTLTSKEGFSKTICFKAIFFLRLPKTNDRIMCVQCVCLFLHAEYGVAVFSLYVAYVHDHCSLFYELSFQCLIQIFKKVSCKITTINFSSYLNTITIAVC